MKAFRCARTGVLFPADYVEQWGRKYGHGLGPVPVSEALTNDYQMPIATGSNPADTMHPVACCQAQVDLVEVTEEEWNEKKAILDIDDRDLKARGKLMRDKQILKSPELAAKLSRVVAAFVPV